MHHKKIIEAIAQNGYVFKSKYSIAPCKGGGNKTEYVKGDKLIIVHNGQNMVTLLIKKGKGVLFNKRITNVNIDNAINKIKE